MIAFLPQGAGGQGGSASTQLKTLMEQVFTTINLFIDWLVDLVIIQKESQPTSWLLRSKPYETMAN